MVNTIEGDAFDNLLSDTTERDRIFGLEGDDTLSSGSRHDRLYGGSGDDSLNLTARLSYINASDAYGGEGNDVLIAASGGIYGGAGEDILTGGYSSHGGRGADLFYGGFDIYGGGGKDTIFGGENIYSGDGKDRVRGDDTDDLMFLGDGNDRAHGKAGHDTILGGSGFDGIFGGRGRDQLFGDSYGDPFSDEGLFGGRGADELWLSMNTGVLTGGKGADLFIFSNAETIPAPFPGARTTIIQDFVSGVDRIDLSRIASNLHWTDGAFSGAAGEVRFPSIGGQLEIDLDGDKKADCIIWVELVQSADLIL